MFAALLGTGMLSKEEGGHTAEFLLSAPISRRNIVTGKILSMILIILSFEIIYTGTILLSFVIIGEKVDGKMFWVYQLAQFFMHLEIACVCFAISSFLKKANLGLGIGIALILYFIDMMEKTIPKLENLKYITPFTYSDAGDLMTSGRIESNLLLIGFSLSLLSLIVAYWKYIQKDIAA